MTPYPEMLPDMKNKLAICLTLIGLSLATMQAADLKVTALGRENSNHLNILVLGEELDESVAIQLQQIATDDFNYFRFLPDRNEALVRESVLDNRKWHGCCSASSMIRKTFPVTSQSSAI